MSRMPQEGPEIIKQRQSFVQEIQLAPMLDTSKFVAAAPAAVAAASALIDNGAILCFDANITDPQLKEDVDNSILFAGLAASRQHDRFTDAANWYRSYQNVLNQLGWIIEGINFTQYQARTSTFEIDKVILEQLQANTSGGEVTLAESAITALQSLPTNDRGFVLWDSTTHTPQNANLQIGVATMSGNNVAISMIGVYFSASQQINSDFLWFSWPSPNIALVTGLQEMELNEGAYSQIRNLVLTKLGPNSVNLLASLI